MTEQTRPAPYPADTRAKGWRFEIDYEKVEQSDTWDLAGEIPMARHALLMMWLMAWRQEPCGSMPAEEALIRSKCQIPPKTWAVVSGILMRGWWLADDGRLYHDTITARVLEMLEYRAKTAKRVADYKLKAREQRGGNALPTEKQRGSNDTGTGTGTTKEKGAKAPSSAKPTVPCPYQAIVDLYHAHLPCLPRAKLMSVARQKALRGVWGWVLSSAKSDGSRRAETAEQALEWLDGYFARAAKNDFLTGKTPRGAGHENWQCDLDFLLTDRGMKQVIEKTQEAA